MADSYLERVAGELADLTLADEKVSGDINIVDEIAGVLGASSQTLEEAFLTAVRVRRAETRARAMLAERAGTPIKVKSRLLSEDEENAQSGASSSETEHDDAAKADAPSEPQSEEDAAFADVLNTLDEFLQTDEGEADTKPRISPSKPKR